MEPGFTGEIGIIGGQGRMGRLMARLFERTGLTTSAFDLQDGPPDWARAGRLRVLVLAVPLPALEETCRALGPQARPDGLVVDIGSVKEEPLRLMREHFPGQVIGGHPLFGPGTEPLDGHTFFLCPGRPGPALYWLRDLLREQGLNPVTIDPGEHDRLMGVVQLLRHLTLFSLGLTLGQEGSLPERWPEMAGPWFGTLARMLDRQLSLGPELFADLATHNPHTARIAEKFQESAQALAEAYSSGDKTRIIDLLNQIPAPGSGDGPDFIEFAQGEIS